MLQAQFDKITLQIAQQTEVSQMTDQVIIDGAQGRIKDIAVFAFGLRVSYNDIVLKLARLYFINLYKELDCNKTTLSKYLEQSFGTYTSSLLAKGTVISRQAQQAVLCTWGVYAGKARCILTREVLAAVFK